MEKVRLQGRRSWRNGRERSAGEERLLMTEWGKRVLVGHAEEQSKPWRLEWEAEQTAACWRTCQMVLLAGAAEVEGATKALLEQEVEEVAAADESRAW
jgi:hypothetical protein